MANVGTLSAKIVADAEGTFKTLDDVGAGYQKLAATAAKGASLPAIGGKDFLAGTAAANKLVDKLTASAARKVHLDLDSSKLVSEAAAAHARLEALQKAAYSQPKGIREALLGQVRGAQSALTAALGKALSVPPPVPQGGLFSRWATTVGRMTGNDLARGIKGGLAGLSNTLLLAVDSPLQFIVQTLQRIPALGELLALPVVGLAQGVRLYEQGASRLKELNDAALKAGVPLQDFQVLFYATGKDAETLSKGMFRLNVALAESSKQSVNAKDKFAWLGVSSEQLLGMSQIDRVRTLADRIRGLKDPTLQSAAAFQAFGKQGFSLLPDLLKGSEKIDALKAKLEATGGLVSPGTVAMVKQAEEAKKAIALIKDSLVNQLVIGAAPILAELAESFKGITVNVGGVSDAVQKLAYGIAYVGAWFVETGKAGADLWAMLSVEVTRAGYVTGNYLAKAVDGFARLAEAMGLDATLIRAHAAALDVIADHNALALVAQEKALQERLAGNVQLSAFRKVDAFFERVKKRMEEATKKAKETNPAAEFAKHFERADKILDGLKSPFDKFKEEAAEIGALVKSKIFDVLGKPDAPFRALAQGYQKLLKDLVPEPKFAGALEAGSREAYSATIRYERSQDRANVQEQIKAILEQQKRVQEAQLEVGKEVARALKKLGIAEI